MVCNCLARLPLSSLSSEAFTVLFLSLSQGDRPVTVCTWDFLQLGERTSRWHCKLNVTSGSVRQPCPSWDFTAGGSFSLWCYFPSLFGGWWNFLVTWSILHIKPSWVSAAHFYFYSFHLLNKIRKNLQNRRIVKSVSFHMPSLMGLMMTCEYRKDFKY